LERLNQEAEEELFETGELRGAGGTYGLEIEWSLRLDEPTSSPPKVIDVSVGRHPPSRPFTIDDCLDS